MAELREKKGVKLNVIQVELKAYYV